ncbi:MAG TPA: hypothetical protein VFC06_05280, partial [Demequina sp.]|nr:hypothetical protein [Demequina sp.]
SADLARERGSYANFEGSGWSKGLVPFDTIAIAEADREVPIAVNRTMRQDWDALRTKVAGGMRNATLMAVAPTASIGLVAGTTPGFDPQFSQIFSRATSSGKFLEVNRNLVKDLQDLGMWEDVKDELLATQGDLSRIEGIPEHLQEVYKTSFQLSPYAFIEVAARAQKWIDQAISRNIYLEDRDVENMMDLYAAAWERGVKTTYYLHVKPRHTAEQSTVRVNKTEKINSTGSANGQGKGSSGPAKKGFGGFGGAKKGFGAATASANAPVADAVVQQAVEAAPAEQAPAAAPSRRGFGGVATPAAPAAEAVSEPTPRTGGISIAPAAVMSQLAAEAFAPAPERKPVVPPSGLPAIVEPAVVETAVVETAVVETAPPGGAEQFDSYQAPAGATVLEVVETVYSADGDMEMVDGVACPVDPMERLQCESCQ